MAPSFTDCSRGCGSGLGGTRPLSPPSAFRPLVEKGWRERSAVRGHGRLSTRSGLFLAILSVGILMMPGVAAAAQAPFHAPDIDVAKAGPATSPLKIVSFTANPSSIFSGNLVFINITAQGGTLPYTYWYRDLPPGCSTVNNSSIQCHPRESQHYLLEGTVNDSGGNQVNATTNLTVSSGFGPPPQINSFVVNPTPGAVGKISYFVVTAVSQSATPTALLAYAFIGLPPGCSTFNQTNLSCVPTEPGTYQVWVRVTDGFSQFSQTSVFFNVTGTAPSMNSGGAGGESDTLLLVVVGVVALVVVLALASYLLYWRKRPPPPNPASAPTQSDGTANPPTPGQP
jgi:hypothetical protein